MPNVSQDVVDAFESGYKESIHIESDKVKQQFLQRYPQQSLSSMQLEEYALGLPQKQDTFCWWLEYGSVQLGSIKGGSAAKMLIYFSPNENTWKIPNGFTSHNEAWVRLRDDIVSLIADFQQGNYSPSTLLSTANVLRTKILYIYSENQLLPIYSQDHIRMFLSKLDASQSDWVHLDVVRANQFLLRYIKEYVPSIAHWHPMKIARFLYNVFLPQERYFKVAAGHQGDMWNEWQSGGYASIGWDDIGDLQSFVDEAEFREAFRNQKLEENPAKATEKAGEVWQFYNLEPGMKIIANQGISKVLAIGTVIAPGYVYRPELSKYKHTVTVAWDTVFDSPLQISEQRQWAFKTVKEVPSKLVQEWLCEDSINPPQQGWYKGLTSLSGYAEALVAVAEAADGIPTPELRKKILDRFPSLKDPASVGSYINMPRQIGLIEQKEDLWTRSNIGDRYIQERDTEVLRSVLLGRYASIYKILWELKAEEEIQRNVLLNILGQYLGWKSTFGTAAQIRWCESFGLVQTLDKGAIRLTERGKDWASDLTNEPPRFEAAPPVEQEKHPQQASQTVNYTFDFSVIASRIGEMNLIYDEDILPDFHSSLHALPHKHFVILSGISGTGKTKLAQAYANAVYGLELNQENPYLLIVAVQPQWNDGASLIGYLSPVTQRYYKTAFLDFLLRASFDEEDGIPYFVCLDEMNLAMVEHYFSDFLSAWESGSPLELHANDGPVSGVPRRIRIPRNLYVVGTVNVDESTHAFSKKVLDRAFVLELIDVDYDRYIASMVDSPHLQKLGAVVKFIGDQMKPFHLHVGYRVLHEMGAYLTTYPVSVDPSRLIDSLLLQKVLPRICGDSRILPALSNIRGFLTKELWEKSRSVSRLDEMIEELENTGMCQFWR